MCINLWGQTRATNAAGALNKSVSERIQPAPLRAILRRSQIWRDKGRAIRDGMFFFSPAFPPAKTNEQEQWRIKSIPWITRFETSLNSGTNSGSIRPLLTRTAIIADIEVMTSFPAESLCRLCGDFMSPSLPLRSCKSILRCRQIFTFQSAD